MAEPKWDDLRVFLAVSRSESLSRAGKALRLDPATVGRRISRLEQALEVTLFMKSPQGYALTQAGARLVARAEAVESAILSAQDDATGGGEEMTGQIRVGAPDGCANYLLPQVCAAICEDHPGLEVQIVALPRVFNLSKREADMAITVSPPTAGRLTSQKLTDYHLHLMASRAYLEKSPPLDTLADLEKHPIIGYIADLIFDAELDYLSEIGGPRTSFASNSVSVQLNWARIGAGLVIGHDFALPFAPELTRVLATEFSLKRSFYLVRHADDHNISRLRLFAQELGTRVRHEMARLEGRT
ncbi:LysR family transcriptional regulator [Litoreibacter arenae]|uniref:Transcriptional regulator, LysR family n=1 Tax=Litoreibacter arenae DSM 19593 TaxID=1123360 RepID=S9QHW4_9RHOB|nr:LysR family transcriptional regulator [Litoreibacter arenae]EPX79133.1 Transcriptional regulator, LysR family [Litoreibacter arenae DSM 19593]